MCFKSKHLESLIKVLKFCKRKSESILDFDYMYLQPFGNYKTKRIRMGRGKGAVANKIVY